MLKKFKQATLRSLKSAGVSSLVQNSRWRRQRLLILAYHGVSTDDEHLWNGSMYMSREVFRARLEMIAKSGCAVLPLDEAITRLHTNDLPDRSVAITFDDGNFDFQQSAFPLLKEFDFPSTLYLTTFYSHYNKPIFGIFCEYLLWKARNETLDLRKITGQDSKIELSSARARETALQEINAFALEQKLSAEEKNALAITLAKELKLDYDALIEKRVMHLLAPEEVARLASRGADIQLHTHRHRAPLDRELFLREIEDNRRSIRAMTGTSPAHFCYPSGVWNQAFLPWLREAGIKSATTCEFGLASPSSNPLLLPRLVDVSNLSPIEFESWLTGVSVALPRRHENARALVGG
ncbi:MAG TPA: polysaccharide deacetylase family protein [Pyrinomonadaceae bacterium]|nr:polysaccharide deacetylase family protein [Pyrinomonadaceae bacterium]